MIDLIPSLNDVLKYSLADHADFHRAIHSEPENDLHHLAYADWLQEQGDERTARHIRQSVEQGDVRTDSGTGLELGDAGEFVNGGTFKGRRSDGSPATMVALYTRSAADPTKAIAWYAPVHVTVGKYRMLEEVLKYTLAEAGDFHRQLHENPDETLHGLAYADYLQEQGKDAHADLIRQHVERFGDGGIPDVHKPVEGRPAFHTVVHIVPKYDSSGLYVDPVGYTVNLNQMSPERDRSVSWETPVMHLMDASDLHKRLVGEGAHNELAFGPAVLSEDTDRYAAQDCPVRYALVPEHDIHPDYQPTGVAPRIGHLLNRLAGEGTDAGALAEGVLRTGDHSLLKILADRLADDDHPLRSKGDGGEGPDLRHAERAMKIDRAVGQWLSRVRDQHFQGTYPHFDHPAEWVSRYLVNKYRFPKLNRQQAIKELKKTVPDATKDDFHHSLMRHADAENVRRLSRMDVGGRHMQTQDGIERTMYVPVEMEQGVSDYVKTLHAERLKQLGTDVPDPHSYTDTRPVNKRLYRLQELKVRYQRLRSGAEYQEALGSLTRAREDWHAGPAGSPYPTEHVEQFAAYLNRSGDPRADIVTRHSQSLDAGTPTQIRPLGSVGLSDGTSLLVQSHAHPSGDGRQVRMTWTPKGSASFHWTGSADEARQLADRFGGVDPDAGRSLHKTLDREGGGRVRYELADEPSFHSNLIEKRYEQTPALVYADWLQKQDKPAHAAVIRSHANKWGRGPIVQKNSTDPSRVDLGPNMDGRRVVSLWQRAGNTHLLNYSSDLLPEHEAVKLAQDLESEMKGPVEKYGAFKAPAGGLVVKESPYAVAGTYAQGGSFVTDLTELGGPAPPPTKKISLKSLLRRVRKARRDF